MANETVFPYGLIVESLQICNEADSTNTANAIITSIRRDIRATGVVTDAALVTEKAIRAEFASQLNLMVNAYAETTVLNAIPFWQSTARKLDSTGLTKRTTLRTTGSADDVSLATEKAIRDVFDTVNTALATKASVTGATVSGAVPFWTATNKDLDHTGLTKRTTIRAAGVADDVSLPTELSVRTLFDTISAGTVVTTLPTVAGTIPYWGDASGNLHNTGYAVVTSWHTPTTDINIASEKLVKDSLDLKASSTHTHALTGSDITGILPMTKGGLGAASFSATQVLYSNGTLVEGTPNFAYNNTYKKLTVGYLSLYGAGPAGNLFLGYLAGNTTVTGSASIGIGTATLASLTSGDNNICFGVNAGTLITIGARNLLAGYGAGEAMVASSNNIGLGYRALHACIDAYDNTAAGDGSGVLLTSGCNSLYGANSGATIITGANNTCLGAGADVNNGARTNTIAVGYGTIATADNQIRLGNASNTNFYCVAMKTELVNVAPNLYIDSNGLVNKTQYPAARYQGEMGGPVGDTQAGDIWVNTTTKKVYLRVTASSGSVELGSWT